MKPFFLTTLLCGTILGLPATNSSAADAPRPVNYVEHVQPMLKEHCGKCHGETIHKSGLDFSNYPSALKGSNGGPVVVAGRPTRSRLLDLVTSDQPAERMPLGGEP